MKATQLRMSKQAEDFWKMLRMYPKQIEMPLAQAREADRRSEDFTSEPADVTFSPAGDVGGLWAETPNAQPGRAILYLFGGGFVLGSPGTRRKTAGHLAVAAKARVLVPDYRLAPEHPFPAALEDVLRAYEWLPTQGAEPSRTVVAGDSAGGGLAVSTVLAVRDRGLPMPAGIVALSPWTDLSCSGESMITRAAADIECTRAGLLEMAGWYLGGGDPRQPLASPLFAELAGLPPLLCVVGGDEALLDDTLRLVRSAGIAGVDATAVIVAGMQHVFPIWAGAFPEADAAIGLIGDWVQARTTGSGEPKQT
jgi:monoterpene epsilon-lactone hydrolase